jgi:hypothetical protein
MSRLSDLPPDMLETLSAALDGALDSKEQAALQARLRDDEDLRLALQELHQVRAGLGMLPRLRAPRNFTLSPEMVGKRAPRPAYPRLRLATALAALAFALTFGLDTFALRFAALPTALQASAPAEGIGAEAPPEAAAEMMLEAAAPAEATPAPSAANAAAERSAVDAYTRATATALPTPEAVLKAGDVGEVLAPEAPAAAPPAPTQAAESEAQESDQALADAIEALPLEQATRRESRWTARPLQVIAAALGVLALGLGVLTLRARRPT